MEVFKNKKDVERKWANCYNKSIGFCPLLNAQCRVDCVAYYPAQIIEGKNIFYFYDSYCKSPLISGVIETKKEI